MFKIIGAGSYLPEKVLTNFDLERMVETSDKWIQERTGIKERRIAADNQNNSDMAYRAAKKALDSAGLTPQDIELIIIGTSTPDHQIPSMAPTIQHKLGCDHVPSFDLNSVCSSFAYGFLTASAMLGSGYYKNCLVIGSDIYSRILNWKDRNTCCIFGDGAGAVVLEADKNSRGVITHLFGANGEDADLISIPAGGSKSPIVSNTDEKDKFFQMQGTYVYEFTITTIPEVIDKMLEKAEMSADEIDFFVLHQANRRIIESIAKRLKISLDKFIINIDKYGNTSSASLPISLDELIRSEKIKRTDTIMMIGFGGGLSWGGIIFEY